ncbi:MFS transporter [Noviherbaspirillum denitrificans]|uniref:MFS transporter n=1 Tax=Noviherbaspirillum denitrificans TaxID=1968433 RepID=A0A254TKR2_9BURK|nr:MFS transporter [Noviherbaspirillum denitrificans]OWW21193.1 MFS transporter [Noviherbaspirillum denitrificans]
MKVPDAAPHAATSTVAPGPFSPLGQRLFAVLWVATVIGNIGTFMRDVASGWLAAEISRSPGSVALVQAAATLPVFLLALPAGALSDIVDRRKFLIIVQVFLALVSATLAFLAAFDSVTTLGLVALTFAGGAGAALLGPAWQSIVPELVPKSDLKAAIALNSLGLNIARAVGPAVGGLLLTTFGAAVTYGVDVLTYAAVVAALIWWQRTPRTADRLGENLGGAMRAGVRYVWASPELRRVLLRAVLFFLFASVAWALLPIVAREVMHGGAGYYGAMLGAIGAGAVGGAILLPYARKSLTIDGLMLAASLLIAAVIVALSFAPPHWAGIVLAVLFGAGWIAVLTTLNATAQSVLPNWVRGRGLAAYLMAFNGAMTAGSLLWGAVGEGLGVPLTLLVGGGCMAVVALVAYRLPLPPGDADLSPANHWAEPIAAANMPNDRGPVLVTVEYRVPASSRAQFHAALQALASERRRDGAFAWGVSEDTADPERLLEWFFVESWAEHLRQHQRVSRMDADLQAEVTRFHAGPMPPKVSHYVALTQDAADAGQDVQER